MDKASAIKSMVLVSLVSFSVSCSNLELGLSDSVGDSTIEYSTVTTTTTPVITVTITEDDLLIEFTEYTATQNDDGTFNITISQDAVDDCYYTISLMYDGNVLEYIEGDGYLESHYGKFAEDDEDVTTTAITTSLDDSLDKPLESTRGKEGVWTFKTISEGTEYIEIKLINSYGDIVSKIQCTCIVDTHLEPHMYYTTINF